MQNPIRKVINLVLIIIITLQMELSSTARSIASIPAVAGVEQMHDIFNDLKYTLTNEEKSGLIDKEIIEQNQIEKDGIPTQITVVQDVSRYNGIKIIEKKVSNDFITNEFSRVLSEASIIKSQTEQLLFLDSIDDEEKRELVQRYYGSVVLPLREYIILRLARKNVTNTIEATKLYDSLFVSFPSDIIPEGGIEEARMRIGPNPSINPYQLKFETVDSYRSRLVFDPTLIISRDINTLIKSPAPQSYMMALKWMTFQMMLTQVHLYNMILGIDEDVEIPSSCRNYMGTKLPKRIPMAGDPDLGRRLVDSLSTNTGLIANDENGFVENFIEGVGSNPLEDGYSGLMTFENYHSALKGSEVKDKWFSEEKNVPSIDDYTHFESVLVFKEGDVKKKLAGMNQKVVETFRQIIASPKSARSFELEYDDDYVFVEPTFQNLSPYLAEMMRKNKVPYYEDLISEPLRNKLSKRSVKIDMPKLFGAMNLRNWGLSTLHTAVKRGQRSSALQDVVVAACKISVASGYGKEICLSESGWLRTGKRELASNKEIIVRLENLLSKYSEKNYYLPAQRVEESEVENVYPLLEHIWKQMRANGLLSEAYVNEYDYLINQMEASNPWARVRLGFLIATEDYEKSAKSSRKGQRRVHYSQRTDEHKKVSKYRLLKRDKKDLRKLAKVLKIDRPLAPFHSDRVLDLDEKKQIWQITIDDYYEQNSGLLTMTLDNGKSAYQNIAEISYKTFVSRDTSEEYAERNNLFDFDSELQENIDYAFDSELGQRSSILLELYKSKGDLKRQQEIFDENSDILGGEFRAKLDFLFLDNAVKSALIRPVFKEAAHVRKREIQNNLNTFCSLDPNDFESFKTLFYSTSSVQNKLNELAGLPGVPDNVLDKLNSLSPADWADIKTGVAQMTLLIGVSTLGGACTVFSGGACAPISLALFAAAAGSLALQADIINTEVKRKLKADREEKKVDAMEYLGFSNSGSSDSVARSWFLTSFEAVGVIPLLGQFTKGVGISSKLLGLSVHAARVKATGNVLSKRVFARSVRTIINNSDISYARKVLAMGSKSADYASSLKKSRLLVKRLILGKISKDELATALARLAEFNAPKSIVTLESIDEVNEQTAKVVAKYFGNNRRSMASFLKSYQRKYKHAAKTYNKYSDADGIVAKLMRAKSRSFAKESTKLNDLISSVEVTGNLESFIAKNIDDLAEFIVDAPMRKRELPFVMLLQGGPHIGGALKGARIPGISQLADGTMVKKFFTARSRLVYESYKLKARASLGIAVDDIVEDNAESIFKFAKTVKKTAQKSEREHAKKLLMNLGYFQDEVVGLVATKHKIPNDVIKGYLFNPKSIEERAFGAELINSIKMGDIVSLKESGELAELAAKELSNYNSVDEFEHFVSSLKILTLSKNAAVVDR